MQLLAWLIARQKATYRVVVEHQMYEQHHYSDFSKYSIFGRLTLCLSHRHARPRGNNFVIHMRIPPDPLDRQMRHGSNIFFILFVIPGIGRY
jgi:hypothetical protein